MSNENRHRLLATAVATLLAAFPACRSEVPRDTREQRAPARSEDPQGPEGAQSPIEVSLLPLDPIRVGQRSRLFAEVRSNFMEATEIAFRLRLSPEVSFEDADVQAFGAAFSTAVRPRVVLTAAGFTDVMWQDLILPGETKRYEAWMATSLEAKRAGIRCRVVALDLAGLPLVETYAEDSLSLQVAEGRLRAEIGEHDHEAELQHA